MIATAAPVRPAPVRTAPAHRGAAAKAPPARLPAEHFAAALAFLALGVAGLVLVAPDLARGGFLAPRVVAVAHLFTLGWITTSIMGALYQFLPVALDRPIRSVRLAHLTFALYAPGLAVFVGGAWAGQTGVMLPGAALFGTGILLFVGNLGATLASATRRDLTWWALAGAAVFLVVTLLLGLALTGNLRWGYLGGGRVDALATHLHVAIAGWVLLVMIGVAHRLLPMFLLSHGAGEGWSRAAVALTASGAGSLTLLHHGPPALARWLPAALTGAGVLCFLIQARSFYRHRRKPSLDPGMRLAAGALGLLTVGLAMAGPAVLIGSSTRLAVAYVTVVLLAISLFVAAHYYKIVPFLVWYHRFGPLAGKRPLPRVGDLFDGRVATAAVSFLFLGSVGLAAAVAAGAEGAARLAALVLAAGAAAQIAQMILLANCHPGDGGEG